jgi:serine/threonine protein kinase
MTRRLGPESVFAGYRIETLVGRGGMGVVYRATDLSLDRPVALKLIAPELADNARFRERFLAEPRLPASLDQRSLVEALPAPTVLVRRGPRPGGLAPPETVTRFG